MVRWRSEISLRIVINWLLLALLNDPGGLGQADGNPVSHRLVNGTLGQSVTLSANIPAAELWIVAWDFRSSFTGKKIQVCTKAQNKAAVCNDELRDRVRLNFNNYSLEILTLMQSDQGLYEVSARSAQNLHNEMIELQVYERVSNVRIQINNISSDGICNVTLSCSVENGRDVIYSWRRGEVTADGSQSVTDNGSKLEISLNLDNTSTVYNCTVRNPVSEDTESIDLAKPCNIIVGGNKEKFNQSLHIGLSIAGISFIIVILFTIFSVCKKKHSKSNEAPNTEGTSESPQYAVIRRPCNARDQPVSPRLHCGAEQPKHENR
ncbi:SLAM family member 9-like isoform X2 [Heterodontus francisci]|uniref:SLAM family member 9-like isoform X2 n=1 Tax=Heterodontus francisci TaxID=7792 RepID=UPI00355C99AC